MKFIEWHVGITSRLLFRVYTKRSVRCQWPSEGSGQGSRQVTHHWPCSVYKSLCNHSCSLASPTVMSIPVWGGLAGARVQGKETTVFLELHRELPKTYTPSSFRSEDCREKRKKSWKDPSRRLAEQHQGLLVVCIAQAMGWLAEHVL